MTNIEPLLPPVPISLWFVTTFLISYPNDHNGFLNNLLCLQVLTNHCQDHLWESVWHGSSIGGLQWPLLTSDKKYRDIWNPFHCDHNLSLLLINVHTSSSGFSFLKTSPMFSHLCVCFSSVPSTWSPFSPITVSSGACLGCYLGLETFGHPPILMLTLLLLHVWLS